MPANPPLPGRTKWVPRARWCRVFRALLSPQLERLGGCFLARWPQFTLSFPLCPSYPSHSTPLTPKKCKRGTRPCGSHSTTADIHCREAPHVQNRKRLALKADKLAVRRWCPRDTPTRQGWPHWEPPCEACLVRVGLWGGGWRGLQMPRTKAAWQKFPFRGAAACSLRTNAPSIPGAQGRRSSSVSLYRGRFRRLGVITRREEKHTRLDDPRWLETWYQGIAVLFKTLYRTASSNFCELPFCGRKPGRDSGHA